MNTGNTKRWFGLATVIVAALLSLASSSASAQMFSCPCDNFYVRVGAVGCAVTVCTLDAAGNETCKTYQPGTLSTLACKDLYGIGLKDLCGNVHWFNAADTPCMNNIGPVWQCCVNACLITDPRTGCDMLDIQPSPKLTCGC